MNSSGRPRIVIVDDMDLLRRLIARILERDGRFDVVGEAEDGEKAVALVGELQPDLVILDLMMPVKTGAQAIPEIRQVSPSTRILVFSGLPGELIDGTADADGFLLKGATAPEIVGAIESLLDMERPNDPS